MTIKKGNKAAPKTQTAEPTYEDDLNTAVNQVLAGEITAEEAVAQVLAEWDVEESAVLSAIESAQAEAAKDPEVKPNEADPVTEVKPEEKAPPEAPKADLPVDEAPLEGELMVTVTVPKAFKLRVDHDSLVEYRAGIQEMPLSHAEHWYSKANGVEQYKK